MCLSIGEAEFHGTIVYAGLGTHPKNGTPVHVMAYQNIAHNLAEGADGALAPNAMLLMLPVAGDFGPENFVDMSGCRSALDDMVEALKPKALGRGGMSRGSGGEPAQVFDHDIYTIVVATDAHSIRAALERVPAHKRPKLERELFDYLAKCTQRRIVLCCFDNREAKKAAPLVAYYEPLFPETLLAPAIDGHDGGAPVDGKVAVDHWVIFGTSDPAATGTRVRYRDALPEGHRGLLPTVVTGHKFEGQIYNGDFAVLVHKILPTDANGRRSTLPVDPRCGIMRVTPDETIDTGYFVRKGSA